MTAPGQYPGLFIFTGPTRMVRAVRNIGFDKTEMIGTFEQVRNWQGRDMIFLKILSIDIEYPDNESYLPLYNFTSSGLPPRVYH